MCLLVVTHTHTKLDQFNSIYLIMKPDLINDKFENELIKKHFVVLEAEYIELSHCLNTQREKRYIVEGDSTIYVEIKKYKINIKKR